MSRKIEELKVIELKAVLRRESLPADGNKAKMVARLREYFDSEEIDGEYLVEQQSNTAEITSLRSELENLHRLVNTAVESIQRCSVTESPTINHNCSGSSESLRQTTPSFGLVRDIAEILPEFNPLVSTSLNSKQFVARINKLQEVYNWDERVLLFAVQSKLQGPAKLWNDGQIEVITNWLTFSTNLVHDFPSFESNADVHIGMMSTIRQPNERIEEYMYKMCAKGRKGSLDDASIIKYIRHGLRHTSLQNAIASMEFKSINELFTAVQRYLSNNVTNQPNNVRPFTKDLVEAPNINQENNSVQLMIKNKYGMNKETEETRSDKKSQTICFNCLEPGHMSINCSKPQKSIRCKRCSKSGHSEDRCTQNQNARESSNNVWQILETVPKPIIKNIIINQIEMSAVIDSGSDRSLIRISDAEKLNCEINDSQILLKGFGGGTFTCEKQINANMTIDEEQVTSPLCIVNDNMISESVLLGTDVLCRDKTRLIIESENCRLEHIDTKQSKISETLTFDERKEMEKSAKFFDEKETKMKEKSENFANVSRIQEMSEQCEELEQKLVQLSQRNENLNLVNKRLMREINDERERSATLQDQFNSIQITLKSSQHNDELLKMASDVTDTQLTEMEGMLETKQERNKTNQEQIKMLWKTIRGKDETIGKLKETIDIEKPLENSIETKFKGIQKGKFKFERKWKKRKKEKMKKRTKQKRGRFKIRNGRAVN